MSGAERGRVLRRGAQPDDGAAAVGQRVDQPGAGVHRHRRGPLLRGRLRPAGGQREHDVGVGGPHRRRGGRGSARSTWSGPAATTSQPSTCSRRTRCRPTNPPAPVTAALTPAARDAGSAARLGRPPEGGPVGGGPAGSARRRSARTPSSRGTSQRVAAVHVGDERPAQEGEVGAQPDELGGQQLARHGEAAAGQGQPADAEGLGHRRPDRVDGAVDERPEELVGPAVDAQVVEPHVDPRQRPAGELGRGVDGVLGLDQDAQPAAAGDEVERAVHLLGGADHRQQHLVGAPATASSTPPPSTGRSR